jgi:transcriptional regulator GlxA family with amidase domain
MKKRKRRALWFLGGVVALTAVAAPLVLAPAGDPARFPPAAPIAASEHAQTIAAMRPPKRERPVIAIIALNEETEVSDLLSTYGVLGHANVADVTLVAERRTPVQLYPGVQNGLRIEPQATTRAFDERHPDGADYVVVPAMDPNDDRFVMDWIVAQRRKGAKIASVCNGSETLAAAGLLDGRRATAHWNSIRDLQQAHPSMRWVRDRRYVADGGIATSTGISGAIPAMIALVEAIAGRARAEQLAAELGVNEWDARHDTSAFELTTEHRKTFVRNTLAFWRHETVGVSIGDGVDEIALALAADAYSRNQLTTVVAVMNGSKTARSRHGLVLRVDESAQAGAVDYMLPPLRTDAPAGTIEDELARIASRYDRPTAAIAALVMEYPWDPAVDRALLLGAADTGARALALRGRRQLGGGRVARALFVHDRE